MPVTSLLFANNNGSNAVYAKTIDELTHTSSKDFDGQNLSWTIDNNDKKYEAIINLYSDGEDTLNYYNSDAQYDSKLGVADVNGIDISGEKIRIYAGGTVTEKNITYTLSTKAKIPNYVVGNAHFSLALSATTNSTITINGSSETTISGDKLTSQDMEIEFSLTCAIASYFKPSEIVVESPKLIITCYDVDSPTLEVLADTNRDNNVYRTINFKASDDKAGLSYAKYYKGTKDNHKTSDEVYLTAIDGKYSFDAEYVNDYTIELADYLGNVTTYFVQKDTSNTLNPLISNLKVSNRNKEIEFTLNFTADKIAHSAKDSIYYAILPISEYNQISSDTNAIIDRVLAKSLGELENSSNTISISSLGKGSYIILAVAKDVADNRCMQVASSTFIFDPTKYSLDLQALTGGYYTSILIDGEEYLEEDVHEYSLEIYASEVYSIGYQAQAGYVFFDVLVDGEESNLTYGNTYTYSGIYAKEKNINASFKYIVDLDFEREQIFDSVQGVLKDNLFNSINFVHEGSLSLDKNIVEIEVYNQSGELVATYNCDGQVTGDFYDVGTYQIVWRIASDYEDNYIQINKDNKSTQIVPKEINGIVYFGYENLVYSGRDLNLTFSLDNANLNDEEKNTLRDLITINYYNYADSEKVNAMTSMINAGTYFAQVAINNNNYIVASDAILDNIIVNKKDVNVTIIDGEYVYNEQVHQLEFVNDGDLGRDAFEIQFQKLVGEIYEDSEFRQVGNYNYSIYLATEYLANYNLIGEDGIVNGSCQIIPQDVYFVLNKIIYDYIGQNISIDYSVYNSADEDTRVEIVSTNNVFSCVSQDGSPIREEGVYDITFVSSDDGYVLHLDSDYQIEVIKTTIIITVTNEYEFDGKNKEVVYTFANDNGDILQSVDGLSLEIYLEDSKIENICEVGTYSYKFVFEEGYYYDIVGGEGTIQIIPAIINVNIVEEYEYCENIDSLENLENYEILYTLISENNTDFANLQFISMQITKSDDVIWGNVGEYSYKFVSNNDSVKFKLNDGESSQYEGIINIVPRKVSVEMTNTYVYSAEEQSLEYSIDNYYGLLPEEISVIMESMLDAKNYTYSLISTNDNYQLVINNPLVSGDNYYVTMLPKTIKVASIQTEYVYTGEGIEVLFTLENPYTEEILYTVNRRQNGVIIESIENAGEYTFEIYSSNSNYVVDYGAITIKVLPKTIFVNVQENIEKEYNGNIQNIEYSFVDDNQTSVMVASKVLYTIDGSEATPKFVGEYDYQIVLLNGNYSISETSGRLTISPKTLVVTPLASQSKVYGDSDSEIEYTLSGLVTGDSVSLRLAREEGSNVGTYPIYYVENSLDNNNYTISFKANTYFYEITQKRLVIIADAGKKTFGENDSVLTYKMYTSGTLVESLPFGDILLGKLSRSEGENVGVYDILLGNLSNDNYAITFVSNKFNIEPKDLYITIDNISVIYGESQNLTYTVEGIYDSSCVYGEIAREDGEDVGDYIISQGTLNSTNYNLIVTNGLYTINKKDVYVSANYLKKTYGDSENLTYVATGLINGDVLLGNLDRLSGEDVGDYEINQGDLNHKNYNILFTPNILTIEKAKLTIKFDDKKQVYGQESTPLTYEVLGLKNNDSIRIRPFRESGEDVGEYEITGAFSIPSNYILEEFVTGKYTIEKARLNLTLQAKTVVYNGKSHTIDVDNFNYPVKYTYKLNGFEVEECVGAGVYTVVAEFEGNNNYYPAKSKEVNLVINKQFVFITITNSSFIYDGTIKYPEFSYDKNIGIDQNSFIYKFENDVFPQEEGKYNFAIIINDNNYEGQTQGTVNIQKTLSITNEKSSIVECEYATFDESSKNLKLVQKTDTKKFNNERVLSVCTLENVSSDAQGYIYTVKVKATEGINNVKVYKVGLSGFSQQAIKIEDGYYVFKIDDPNDKYIITTEIKTLSTLAWILILVAIVLVFTVALIIVAHHKRKKAKVAVEKISDKDIETYNVN